MEDIGEFGVGSRVGATKGAVDIYVVLACEARVLNDQIKSCSTPLELWSHRSRKAAGPVCAPRGGLRSCLSQSSWVPLLRTDKSN
jgi:hypothetical protein